MKTQYSILHSDFELLKPLGYTNTPVSVVGRASIADLFSPKAGGRCGIYVLHFQNGELYVGQSDCVTRRFLDHRKRWEDIRAISFKVVPKAELDSEEKEHVIPALEHTKRLRNKDEVSFINLPAGECDLDDEIPRAEQERWLVGENSYLEAGGPRAALEEQRMKNRGLFKRFARLPDNRKIIEILRAYIRVAIPAPRRTEYVYWSLTCLPKGWYARLNINWQEVFGVTKRSDRLRVAFQMSKSPFTNRVLQSLSLKYPSIATRDHRYRPGGKDQMRVEVDGEDAIPFINEKVAVTAVRRMNLHLMRKGASVNRMSHCLDLADAVLDGQLLTELLPEPRFTTSAKNQHHNDRLRSLYEAALSGDSAALLSVATQPDAKNGYSRRVHAYKQALLRALRSRPAPPLP